MPVETARVHPREGAQARAQPVVVEDIAQPPAPRDRVAVVHQVAGLLVHDDLAQASGRGRQHRHPGRRTFERDQAERFGVRRHHQRDRVPHQTGQVGPGLGADEVHVIAHAQFVDQPLDLVAVVGEVVTDVARDHQVWSQQRGELRQRPDRQIAAFEGLQPGGHQHVAGARAAAGARRRLIGALRRAEHLQVDTRWDHRHPVGVGAAPLDHRAGFGRAHRDDRVRFAGDEGLSGDAGVRLRRLAVGQRAPGVRGDRVVALHMGNTPGAGDGQRGHAAHPVVRLDEIVAVELRQAGRELVDVRVDGTLREVRLGAGGDVQQPDAAAEVGDVGLVGGRAPCGQVDTVAEARQGLGLVPLDDVHAAGVPGAGG